MVNETNYAPPEEVQAALTGLYAVQPEYPGDELDDWQRQVGQLSHDPLFYLHALDTELGSRPEAEEPVQTGMFEQRVRILDEAARDCGAGEFQLKSVYFANWDPEIRQDIFDDMITSGGVADLTYKEVGQLMEMFGLTW